MRKSVDVRLLVVAVLFGFLGGAASSLVLPGLVFAQGEPAANITAREFRVVDPEGNVFVVIGGSPQLGDTVAIRVPGQEAIEQVESWEGRMQILDSHGERLWSFPPPLVHPLSSGHAVE